MERWREKREMKPERAREEKLVSMQFHSSQSPGAVWCINGREEERWRDRRAGEREKERETARLN